MKNKKFTLLVAITLIASFTLQAAIILPPPPTNKVATTTVVKENPLLTQIKTMKISAFEKATGHELNFIQKIAFKKLQKKLRKSSSTEISKGLYIILAIFGFGWVGIGLNDNFKGGKWILSLVLYILGYLPGLIYTLVKMKDYYN